MTVNINSTEENVNNVKKVNVLGKVFDNCLLLETIFNPKTDAYTLVVSTADNQIQRVSQFKHLDKTYFPLVNSDVRNGRVILPRSFRVISSPNELLSEIQEFIHKYVDVDPGFEEVAARYVMMTWVYDKFPKIPYLRVLGPWGSGKSRFLDVVAAISYHSVYLGEAVTNANIYRTLDKYPGTLIFDEANFGNTSKQSFITQILNNGNKRGGGVTRTNNSFTDTKFYSSFGPKIIAAHQPFDDISSETRFLTTITRITNREDIPYYLPPYNLWEEASVLREKLLGYRLKTWRTLNVEKIPDCVRKFNGRVREIFSPLLIITNETKFSPALEQFVEKYIQAINAQLGLSLEGKVAEAITKCYKPGRPLYIKEIAKYINRERNGSSPMSERRTGSIITTLGLMKARKRDGTIVLVDNEIIKQLENSFMNPQI